MASFEPRFIITARIASALMRIEAAKSAVEYLPITPWVLATLRHTARLLSTHLSTRIEGNRLTQEEVSKVVEERQHVARRERDEREVLGYFQALEKIEEFAAGGGPITERTVQLLHAMVMAGGSRKVKPTTYRDGQNVIRDSRTNRIVYMPPEAKDVVALMRGLLTWIESSEAQGVPCPLRAGIAHYQFATIHPYYDGNGRTARLLTTLILHAGGYSLKGLYSLEEYYARDLGGYYDALNIGPSYNYYGGRAESDITTWVEYFCEGAAGSFENVKKRAQEAAGKGGRDFSARLRRLDPRQRVALELFRENESVTSRDVEKRFAISQRSARNILREWVMKGFILVIDPAKKSRKYGLAEDFKELLG